MTSSAALQAHYDEIQANMPVLPLAATPKCFANLDLHALDPSSAGRIVSTLREAAAGLNQCQICSRSSNVDGLRYHISSHLDFHSRTVKAVAGHFACSLCRALGSPSLLLELATPALGSEDYGRSEALQQLFLHFAAVNSAPASITGNPEALAVWVQELACRAYSMQVVASSLRGWKLAGPTGQVVQQGTAGAGLSLLQQLLEAQQQVPLAAVAVAAGRHLERKSSKAKQQQQQQPPVESVAAGQRQGKQKQGGAGATPGKKRKQSLATEQAADKSSKKAKKHAGTAVDAPAAEAADSLAAATPTQQQVHQPVGTQDTAKKLKKKHRQEQWTPGKAGSTAGSAELAPAAMKQRPAAAFKTPQVAKARTQGKTGKRRLSDPS